MVVGGYGFGMWEVEQQSKWEVRLACMLLASAIVHSRQKHTHTQPYTEIAERRNHSYSTWTVRRTIEIKNALKKRNESILVHARLQLITAQCIETRRVGYAWLGLASGASLPYIRCMTVLRLNEHDAIVVFPLLRQLPQRNGWLDTHTHVVLCSLA